MVSSVLMVAKRTSGEMALQIRVLRTFPAMPRNPLMRKAGLIQRLPAVMIALTRQLDWRGRQARRWTAYP